jgi:DnaK suppressor protein
LTTKSENKWDEISVILQQMRSDTLRDIRTNLKSGADSIIAGDLLGDLYDQASSERDREMVLLMGDREREKLNAIDESLLRIKEDEYGICEECEEEIPLGRLKAMPFTRHCVNCKSDLEKLQAQTGRSEEDQTLREMPVENEEEDS